MKEKKEKDRLRSYAFYLQDGVKRSLYAFTDDPYIAELFKSTRSDDFIELTKDYLDEEDLKSDINKYQMRRIVIQEGTTVKDSKLTKFIFPLTVFESTSINSITSAIINVGLIANAWSDVSILNPKYQKYLERILFIDAQKYIEEGSDWINRLYIDDFNAIMKIIGNYLRL